ncbi:REST corepressor 1 [Brachionus plicatilis]|uniref:REST corepressor 1 n=1 Tax=Brachionus plicatilis TaxID=10195 RepID=A0A3M7TAM4_BRAPC|nr:REST corepressor 1 [Brachionus plicatilis]
MQLKMLDCVDIPNDQTSLALTKSQESDLNSNYNPSEHIESEPEQVDPGPNLEQTSSRSSQNEYYDQYDDFKIRVGDQYQIDLSDYSPSKHLNFRKNIVEKETPIWMPSECVDGPKMDSYLKELSKINYFSLENAISALYDFEYDVEKAIDSLRSCSADPNQWSKEDVLLFEQGIWYYGKNFHRINQILPHKTHANLVSFYYKWKKSRDKSHHSIVHIEAGCSINSSTSSSETFGEFSGSNGDSNL